MTTYKIVDLTGVMLDAAIAKAEGLDYRIECWMTMPPKPAGGVLMRDGKPDFSREFRPHEDRRICGALMEREAVNLHVIVSGWAARSNINIANPTAVLGPEMTGPTALIAAMRAYLASKFGDTVDLPR